MTRNDNYRTAGTRGLRASTPRQLLKALLVSLIFTAASGSARAESAYRWVDSKGRVFYGSTPPAGARQVEAVKAKSYSKYSSSKMLKAHGPLPTKSSAGTRVTPTNRDHSERARLKDISREDSVSEATLIDPSELEITAPAQLDHSPVSIERDSKNRVTQCGVNVKNYGAERASGIRVTFEFSDGTLIQTEGPQELRSGEDATYSVPANLLPITLRPTKHSDPDLAKIAEMPKVLFDFSSIPDSGVAKGGGVGAHPEPVTVR